MVENTLPAPHPAAPDRQHSLTLCELVERVTNRFEHSPLYFGHGTDNASDEAYWLAVRGSSLSFEQADARWHNAVDAESIERVMELARQRCATRKPVAYLLKEAWFADRPFYVDERVLVPRSHFGPLIHSLLRPWINPETTKSVLDLCTGSGCIGIAAGLILPDAGIVLADVDPCALEVAQINVRKHAIESRTELVLSDLFESLEGRCFDVIVCNPPYVRSGTRNSIPPEYDHEPAIGLYSGIDGLDCPLRILAQAGEYMSGDGVLMMELASATPNLQALLPTAPLRWALDDRGDASILICNRSELADINSNLQA